MRYEWMNIKKGNPYVNYIVGLQLRNKGLDLSTDDVEDISSKYKIDYSNPLKRKVKQTLRVIKSNVYKPKTIFYIDYFQYKKELNKFGRKIKQWTDTQVSKINLVLPPSTLHDFLN